MAADEHKTKMRSILIDNVRYRTTFTKKFAERKPYEVPDPKVIKAFIPGTIRKVYVRRRKKVEQGEELLVLEAMKMENIILAPMDGVIKEVLVKSGQAIAKGDVMLVFK
jgi:biotin carboxyl carrier protein